MKQLKLLKNKDTRYGGELLRTRKGRARGRPIDSRNSMHLVLRSSRAKGPWSMRHKHNAKKVNGLLAKFSKRFAVQILSYANVGNHLHLHIQLTNRRTYRPFIRGLTGAIAMAITGVNRWNPARGKLKFWDHRPFSRVVFGWRAFKTLKAYIQVNQLEGLGTPRDVARAWDTYAYGIDYQHEFGTS